jgi:hypothetical protein
MTDMSISAAASRAAMPIRPNADVRIESLDKSVIAEVAPAASPSSVVTISPEGARMAGRVQVPPGGT